MKKILWLFLLSFSAICSAKNVTIYRINEDDFYAFSNQKQCFVPVNYSELGHRWYLHPEQDCLDGSDEKHLHQVVLSPKDYRPIPCEQPCIKCKSCKACRK